MNKLQDNRTQHERARDIFKEYFYLSAIFLGFSIYIGPTIALIISLLFAIYMFSEYVRYESAC